MRCCSGALCPIASFALQVEDCQYSGCHVKRRPIFDFLSLVHPATRASGKDGAADARATHCRAAAQQGLCKVWPTFMTAFECCKTCPLALSLDRESYLNRVLRQADGFELLPIASSLLVVLFVACVYERMLGSDDGPPLGGMSKVLSLKATPVATLRSNGLPRAAPERRILAAWCLREAAMALWCLPQSCRFRCSHRRFRPDHLGPARGYDWSTAGANGTPTESDTVATGRAAACCHHRTPRHRYRSPRRTSASTRVSSARTTSSLGTSWAFTRCSGSRYHFLTRATRSLSVSQGI